MPEVGLEPTRLYQSGDFKSPMATITSLGQTDRGIIYYIHSKPKLFTNFLK